jgi:hypothetical protein
LKSRIYLETNFKVHVLEQQSQVASHCRLWSLSDPIDLDFKTECQHDHSIECADCNLLEETMNHVEILIGQMTSVDQEELFHEFQIAKNAVYEWQQHILRGQQQELGKKSIIDSLDESSVYWLRDFGMKLLPRKYREPMSDWFAKKGISIHVDCIFYVDSNNELRKVSCHFLYFALTELILTEK